MSSSHYYVYEEPPGQRPPRWWLGYLVGGLLLVFGLVVPCVGTGVLGVAALSAEQGPSMQGPGSLQVRVDRAQRMVVWLEEPEGVSPDGAGPAVPPDLKVTVTGTSGRSIVAHPPAREIESIAPDVNRTAAAVFNTIGAGEYTVDVKGTLKANQSIVVTPDETVRVGAMGLGLMMLVLLGIGMVIGGIVMLVIVAVRHVRYRRQWA